MTVITRELPEGGDRLLRGTPGQTIGPFFKFGLEYADGPYVVPPYSPGAVHISGNVYDGRGFAIPDALVEIWGAAPDDVWAVGDSGTILHYDGHDWALASLGNPNGDAPTNLFGIWGSGPSDVWIVGEGVLLHRSATSRRHP